MKSTFPGSAVRACVACPMGLSRFAIIDKIPAVVRLGVLLENDRTLYFWKGHKAQAAGRTTAGITLTDFD